ncbi:MAG: hypothetical protein MPL62_03825 [Alphaproteobacteria bacterium]|nr:hypothetical protein [Alphaproteobacteria bacterium]
MHQVVIRDAARQLEEHRRFPITGRGRFNSLGNSAQDPLRISLGLRCGRDAQIGAGQINRYIVRERCDGARQFAECGGQFFSMPMPDLIAQAHLA